MKKSFLFFLSAAAFIFLAVFLIFSRKFERTNLVSSPSFLKSFFAPTPTPSPWLAYSNLNYGYFLNYPRGWQKTEWDIQGAAKLQRPQEGMILQQVKFEGKERSFQVVVWLNRQKAAITQWLRWYRHEDLELKKIPQKSNYQILDKEAFLIFQEKTPWGYPVVRIFFSHQDKMFELVAQNPSRDLEKTYQEIIQSFRLTEGQ